MSTYAIGDIQGCWRSLQALLKSISYRPNLDTLVFVGDILNRGEHSLDVMRFVMDLDRSVMVLGNHEIYCLITALGHIDKNQYQHTLHSIFDAPDCSDICDYLSAQPLLKHLPDHNAVIVHAGIPPQWSLTKAKEHAQTVHDCLQDKESSNAFLPVCFGDHPARLEDAQTHFEKMRYTINALTRMRFCTSSGELDLNNKKITHTNPAFKPWFNWARKDSQMPDILFGHWASQEGVFNTPGATGLDTGCVYGKRLTAMRLEDRQLFYVDSMR